VIFGDGTQSRDFCFIENVIEANLLAAEAPGASGGVFNIACGRATDLNQVVQLIAEALGKPVSATYEAGRAGDVKHSLADIGAARRVLGYTAAVSFEDGLLRTIEWYKRPRTA
jgi:UDP-glucose 4-epimerase